MDQEMKRPMTAAEEERWKAGTPRETIAVERSWNKRPDGLAIKMPAPEKIGKYVTLELKEMSDVTDPYVTGKTCSGLGFTCSGSSIRVNKVGTSTDAWPPRMVGEPEKLHSRSTISK